MDEQNKFENSLSPEASIEELEDFSETQNNSEDSFDHSPAPASIPKTTFVGIGDSAIEKIVSKSELIPGFILKDRYEIVKSIGKGGFGIVYEARDIQNNDEKVAVKTLKHNIDDYEQAQKRFQREIELCSSINNKHAVKIYDSGITADNILYYIMEFLEGTTLDEHLARLETFNFFETKTLLLQMLEALGEAHKKGIVHRDIKPANISLYGADPESKNYQVKVLDFGIAKVTCGEEQLGAEKLTQTGAFMGSPAYMSPERLRGKKAEPSSDVFALGLMALEMITGYQAAEGETPMDVAMYIMTPSEIDIEDWVKNSTLGAILVKCVRKDPAMRYRDANELAEALNAVSDTALINEYNAAKLAGKTSRHRTITRTTLVGEAPIQSELMNETVQKMNTQMLMIIGIVVVLFIIILIVVLKVVVPKNATPEPEKTLPVYVQQLEKGAALGMGHGTAELMRVTFMLSSTPEGATVVTADDGVELGKTPISLSPIAVPIEGQPTPWNLILKADGYEDYKFPVIPRITMNPSVTITMQRQLRMRGDRPRNPDAQRPDGNHINAPAPNTPPAAPETKPDTKVETKPDTKVETKPNPKTDTVKKSNTNKKSSPSNKKQNTRKTDTWNVEGL